MNVYQPRTEDMHFVLSRVLNAPARLQALPAFAEVDAELMKQVLDEAGKFVADVIAPLNRDGDEIGAQWRDGAVTMPPGFKEAYQSFWQSGWPALAAATEDGGQGLPSVLEAMLYEMLSGANHGWTMAPGLLHGAYDCIKHHASDAIKTQYLDKVATGEWLATMCLTEPHAGSDLGLISTKAVPLADGKYAVSGTKIFISGGEHDLTDNIVHLVLARLPDAPPGPKGLSLFLVPKFHQDGSRSRVYCDRIEEKMGLHASPTCVMRFDGAQGELVGALGQGLNAMFVMMNAARLHVALQGVGTLDAAWQKANNYALERRQMRAPKAATVTNGWPDLIIEHPAIQRILDTQRAWIDGSRVLAYETGLALDIAKHHPDNDTKLAAQAWCAIITPLLKAACTDQGFQGASDCLQVLGGHGYVSEWGIEQHVRDVRVAMIYEGTNEIQANDLLFRKVLADKGLALNALLDHALTDLDRAHARTGATALLFEDIRDLTALAVDAHGRGAQHSALCFVAPDYLRALTLALLAWSWARIEQAGAPAEAHWQKGLQAFHNWVLPEFHTRANVIRTQLVASPRAPEPLPSVNSDFLKTLLGYNTRRASLTIVGRFMEHMAEFELRPAEFSVLALIGDNPGITSRQLCGALNILPPNMVTILKVFEKRGLLLRDPHPTDGRATALRLSPSGTKLMCKARDTAFASDGKAANRLSANEQQTLIRLLQKIYD
jgi:alkylation response protein AidB-like acyl-CoA dehydrogenase/DNA-binding MarR family transcriptional regulator